MDEWTVWAAVIVTEEQSGNHELFDSLKKACGKFRKHQTEVIEAVLFVEDLLTPSMPEFLNGSPLVLNRQSLC
jgi:hypothetical protein